MMAAARETLRVAVVGARRQRQGTGEYLAGAFAAQGCRVEAIVGTSAASLEAARGALEAKHEIHARGYLSLRELLRAEKPDLVVIASPPEHHLEPLRLALDAGCHVFCEKPLFWDRSVPVRETAEALVSLALARGRLLAVNTQWPETLPAFHALYPGALGPVSRFDMWLSPVSLGLRGVVDSAPHLLSMLHALAGSGAIRNIHFRNDLKNLSEAIEFTYVLPAYEMAVTLTLKQCPEPPRPAGYRINGKSVERRIAMPNYEISFAAGHLCVPVRDPLVAAVERFIRGVRAGSRPDRESLVDGMTQLEELVAAREAADSERQEP
jgi:predicted dehydrogenase